MSLFEHLKIRTPVVWVNTPDPYRYADAISMVCPTNVYLIDPREGFSVWDKQTNSYKPVLIEQVDPMTGEPSEGATFDLGTAIDYLLKNGGTMLLFFAHKMADDLAGLFGRVFSEYRSAFYADNLSALPPQLICFSHGADMPDDLAHLIQYVDPGLPELDELVEITAMVSASAGGDLKEPVDAKKVAASGVGLSESDFIKSCLLSLSTKKTIDPLYVNEYKMSQIRAGGHLEIRRPQLTLEDIGGLDHAKKLIRHIEWMWNNPDESKQMDLVPLRRLLLVGVPGSGKSAICESVASTLKLDLAKTGISQNMNKYIGQSEENMRSTFAQIKALAPIVCWVDEFGRDVSQGHWQGDGGTTSRVHGEFLTGLQELPDNVLFMAAANIIDHVAPEMLRADRFDRIMFVGFPTRIEREDIFKIHLGAQWPDFDIPVLAEMSSAFTGAEIKALIRETRFKVSMDDHRSITTDDILGQIPEMKNRMWLRYRPQIIAMYERAIADWDWASSSQKAEAGNVINETIDVSQRKSKRAVGKF